MAALYFVVFVSFLDTHAQMPILASYSASLGAAPFLIGLTVGLYSFTNIIGNGISGMVMDRSGWRAPLAIGLFFASISLFGYALADDAVTLLAIRAFHGLAGGLLIPATLMAISSLCSGEELGRRMAGYGIVIGCAAFIGPMFAGVFATSQGFEATYVVLATLMMVSFVAVIAAMRLIPCERTMEPRPLYPIRITPGLKIAFITAFATMGATGTLVSHMPIHGSGIGLESSSVGMGFATFALMAVFLQMMWAGRLSLRISAKRACVLGLSLMTVALLALPGTESLTTLIIVMALFGIGFGTVFPSMLMLVHSGEAGARGRMMALFFVFYSLGVAVVPPLAGYLFQYNGIIPTLTSAAVCILVLSAVQFRRWT